MLTYPATSPIKKVGKAESCNFLASTQNFENNSDRELQISNTGDYECSKF